MVFWGVEVKPGSSFIHSPNNALGRLRVTQATLGRGSANGKIHVKCRVGEAGTPTFLCALLPEIQESIFLNLEFKEAKNVIFSVTGTRSVHLSGYYKLDSDSKSDTESYGINIEDTDSEESSWGNEENEYGGSFIDDSDVPDSSPSPVSHQKETVKFTHQNDEPKGGSQLRKKYEAMDSEDDVHSREDDDGYLFGIFSTKIEKSVNPAILDVEEKTDCETADMGGSKELKQNSGPLKPKRNIRKKSKLQTDDSGPEKRTRRRMKEKTQDEDGVPTMTDEQEAALIKFENQAANVTQIPKTTLSNGLMIEVLVNGPPDGKVAVQGKKVKVHYTCMLKESGHIFDSNDGRSVIKFRLGDKEFIDGLNIGIDGMRVGEKRRLTIPPSLGFGEHGNGEKVPPNSWLVYEVELVRVHK